MPKLARQTTAIPVFVKIETNRWQYFGLMMPNIFYTSGPEFERHIAG
ncbi:MAG: hypothetical protein ABIQ99_02940 [Thermoflexales bacterium]